MIGIGLAELGDVIGDGACGFRREIGMAGGEKPQQRRLGRGPALRVLEGGLATHGTILPREARDVSRTPGSGSVRMDAMIAALPTKAAGSQVAMMASTWPSATTSSSLTKIDFSVPAAGDETGISIFMAST